MAYRIKGWAKFQHFKDRRPPWIKLYRELLEDLDWHDLDGDAAKLLVSLWLLASEDENQDGRLPDSRRLAFRLRTSETKITQALSKLSHWLEQDDIDLISTGYQDDAPEAEAELRQSSESEAKKSRGTRLNSETAFTQDWADFCKVNRPDLNPAQVFAKFSDYWTAKPGKQGTKLDWFATWRNWVREERAGQMAKPRHPHTKEDFDAIDYGTGITKI